MSEPLINRLAERLGCSPEAAATALRQLVEQLHQQLEQEGQATIAGLGRLIRTEQGLQFEPDTSLAQAVNHRFAGLEPVTVEPPAAQPYRKTEVVPPEEEAVETEPAATESTREEPAETASPFYEVEGESKTEAKTVSSEAAQPPPETEPAAEAPPTEPPEPETAPELEPAVDTPQPTPQSGEPPLRPPRPPRIRVSEERRRGLPVWIPAALLIVVLGVVAVWFLFFSRPSTPEAVPPAPPRTEAEQAMSPETTATVSPAVTDTAVAATETPRAETPPPASPPTGNYALIVGSVTSRRAAEQVAERFRRTLSAQGLPVTIVTVTTNGTTRYRVAVGRYSSPEEALAAKRQLGEVLPPDAWVLRLPSTTQ